MGHGPRNLTRFMRGVENLVCVMSLKSLIFIPKLLFKLRITMLLLSMYLKKICFRFVTLHFDVHTHCKYLYGFSTCDLQITTW